MRAEDEAQLIRRARQGDDDAVSQLYLAHVQAIYRYIYYRVGDINVAEDLTADTFVRAIEGLSTYEQRGVPFRAWLYRIARARAVDHLRRQDRRQHQPLDTLDHAAEEDVEDDVALRLRLERLSTVLPRLTDEQQDVLLLRFIEGYSTAETAALIGKTPGSVKSLQYRALRSLARIFEQEFGVTD